MEELVLSREDFRAFSSDTRASIAKLLRGRNYTLSELSKRLGMASPTVKTHLDKLVKAEIVRQLDEGRKWKYYALTRKGRKILEPEDQPKIMIVIGIAAIALVGTIFLLAQSMPGMDLGQALQAKSGATPGYSATAPSYSASQNQAKDNTAEAKQSACPRPETSPLGAAANLPGYAFLAIMLAFVLGYFISKLRTAKGKHR